MLEDNVGTGCARLTIEDPTVTIDQADRTRDAGTFRFERAILAADFQARVREQRERKLQLCRVLRMALNRRRVDAEGPYILLSVALNLIAHGGELAVSAGSVVAGIKDEENARSLQQVTQSVALAVGCASGEVGGNGAGCEEGHGAAGKDKVER
jgi:hypothetical protein